MGCVQNNPPNYENMEVDEEGYVRMDGYKTYHGPQLIKTNFYAESRQVCLTTDGGVVNFHVESALHIALNLLQTYRDNATGGLDVYFLREVQRIVTDSQNMKNHVGIYRGEHNPTTRYLRRAPFDDSNYISNGMEPYTPCAEQVRLRAVQHAKKEFDMRTARLQSRGQFNELRRHLGCPSGPPPPRSQYGGQCCYCGHYNNSHKRNESGLYSSYV